MFFISGETDSVVNRGAVADRCPSCGQVTVLSVAERYRKSHIYFIPLGSGKLVETTLSCNECKGKAAVASLNYAQFLSPKDAKALSTGEVLGRTNPRLAESLAVRSRLEEEVRSFRDVDSGRPDPRVQLAFAKLADLDRGLPHVQELQSRLAQWGTLSRDTQDTLLKEIDLLTEREEQKTSLLLFVQDMANRFKPDVDGGLSLLAFLVVTVGGITAAAMALAGGWIWLGILAALVAGCVVGGRTHAWLRVRMHRRFFQKTLLPEAERRGVPVEEVIGTLRSIELADPQLHPAYRGMVKAIPLLEAALAEQSRLARPAP